MRAAARLCTHKHCASRSLCSSRYGEIHALRALVRARFAEASKDFAQRPPRALPLVDDVVRRHADGKQVSEADERSQEPYAAAGGKHPASRDRY